MNLAYLMIFVTGYAASGTVLLDGSQTYEETPIRATLSLRTDNGDVFVGIELKNISKNLVMIDKLNLCNDAYIPSEQLEVMGYKNGQEVGLSPYVGLVRERIDNYAPENFVPMRGGDKSHCEVKLSEFYETWPNFDEFRIRYRRANLSYRDIQSHFDIVSPYVFIKLKK